MRNKELISNEMKYKYYYDYLENYLDCNYESNDIHITPNGMSESLYDFIIISHNEEDDKTANTEFSTRFIATSSQGIPPINTDNWLTKTGSYYNFNLEKCIESITNWEIKNKNANNLIRPILSINLIAVALNKNVQINRNNYKYWLSKIDEDNHISIEVINAFKNYKLKLADNRSEIPTKNRNDVREALLEYCQETKKSKLSVASLITIKEFIKKIYDRGLLVIESGIDANKIKRDEREITPYTLGAYLRKDILISDWWQEQDKKIREVVKYKPRK